MEINVNKQTAETIYINHPEASYGIFCFNSIGDLFLNSDWGFFGYAWRAYGKDFKTALSTYNAEYIVQKFGINYRGMTGKNIPPFKEKNLLILVTVFLEQLKIEVSKN